MTESAAPRAHQPDTTHPAWCDPHLCDSRTGHASEVLEVRTGPVEISLQLIEQRRPGLLAVEFVVIDRAHRGNFCHLTLGMGAFDQLIDAQMRLQAAAVTGGPGPGPGLGLVA